MPLTTKEKEYIMTLSVRAHFSEEERKVLADLADGLMTLCHKMDCGTVDACEECPLNALTDRAYTLGEDIAAFLRQGDK